MYLIPVPALADNYLYLLLDSKHVPVADPTDAGTSRTLRNQHGLDPESILVTHPHTDSVMPNTLKKRALIVGKTDDSRAAYTHKHISTRLRSAVPASPIICGGHCIAASTNKFSPDCTTAPMALAAISQ
jgi:hypothetical protein